MKRFRSLIILIPAVYIYYALVAYFGAIISSKYEIFPAFNWSLFTYVSDVRDLCEVEILSIDGVRLDRPTRLAELQDQFRAGRDATVLKLLQKVCRAKYTGRDATFEDLRDVFESRYLSDKKNVEYRLVIHNYEPIARWRDGSTISTQVLGKYQTGSMPN